MGRVARAGGDPGLATSGWAKEGLDGYADGQRQMDGRLEDGLEDGLG
jgi:hypothetical protein